MASKDTLSGTHILDLDTPALILDLDAMERNLSHMAEFLAGKHKNLRPHAKIHLATPEIARYQLAAGAIGITCAKLSEAEVLSASGIQDILIANQIVGKPKMDRLVEVARMCDLKVAVDSYENVDELSRAAVSHHVKIGILVEVNIGHNRCGVAPFGPTLDLARKVQKSPGLVFRGLMGYDGHCTTKISEADREGCSIRANQVLADTRHYLEDAGVGCDIVSGAGTFTYRYAAEIDGITEVQAGSYLLMDTAFRDFGVREFDCTLTVMSTVISRPCYPGAKGLLIVDAGRKTISTMLGNPEVKRPTPARVLSLSDEHGRVVLENEGDPTNAGEKVEFRVRDANGTLNQFDRIYAARNERVEAVWKIPLCGNHR